MKTKALCSLIIALILSLGFMVFLVNQTHYSTTDALWDTGMIVKGQLASPIDFGIAPLQDGGRRTVAAALYVKPILGLYMLIVAWFSVLYFSALWALTVFTRSIRDAWQEASRERAERRRMQTVRVGSKQ